jgi:hypothetical protein
VRDGGVLHPAGAEAHGKKEKKRERERESGKR